MSRYVLEMRDKQIQQDSLRFRRNIERTGELIAYEISKNLDYQCVNVETPLGQSPAYTPEKQIVLGTILRAGLPFHQGFLNMFDHAENAFVSAYRKYKDKLKFDINIEYIAAPNIEDKVLIIADPMLATGSSMELAYHSLLTHGRPSEVHIASVIASRQAIDYLEEHLPQEVTLWVAAVDEKINDHSYIVPGLGDAGDLSYGSKL
ncbi:uracil phosphoribosyltransferase [Porphyromonas crevioricanis JCM 15906]|nr:uracil phosphoribosyltransferase [Porphyromonas crevioricanis JCM 15906]GAD08222.1 uracil phosphoribosyltransferase [Porphyromonas crevioricanis JCM 13913]